MLKDPLASTAIPHKQLASYLLPSSCFEFSFPLLSNINFHITLHYPKPPCSIDQVTSNKKK